MFCKFCGKKLETPGAVCRFCGQQDAALEGGIGFFDLLSSSADGVKAMSRLEADESLPSLLSEDYYTYDEEELYKNGRTRGKLTFALLAAMSAALVLAVIIAAISVNSMRRKYEKVEAEKGTYIEENTQLRERLQQYEGAALIDGGNENDKAEAEYDGEETAEQQSAGEKGRSGTEEHEADVSDTDMFVKQPKSKMFNPGTRMVNGKRRLFELEFAGINCSVVWQRLDENGTWQQLDAVAGFESTCDKKDSSTAFTLEYSGGDASGEEYAGIYRCIIIDENGDAHISNEAEISVEVEEAFESPIDSLESSVEDGTETKNTEKQTDDGKNTDTEGAIETTRRADKRKETESK